MTDQTAGPARPWAAAPGTTPPPPAPAAPAWTPPATPPPAPPAPAWTPPAAPAPPAPAAPAPPPPAWGQPQQASAAPAPPAPEWSQQAPAAPAWGQPPQPATGPVATGWPTPPVEAATRATPRSGHLIAGAGVLGIVAAVLPWITLSGSAAETFEAVLEAQGEGLGGLDKDGSITIVLAAAAAVFGILRGLGKAVKAAPIVGLVAGALITLIAVVDIADVSSAADESPMFATADLTVGVGIGLWLTLVAGIAIAVTSILALVRKT